MRWSLQIWIKCPHLQNLQNRKLSQLENESRKLSKQGSMESSYIPKKCLDDVILLSANDNLPANFRIEPLRMEYFFKHITRMRGQIGQIGLSLRSGNLLVWWSCVKIELLVVDRDFGCSISGSSSVFEPRSKYSIEEPSRISNDSSDFSHEVIYLN